MSQLLFGTNADPKMNSDVLRSMFQFRYSVFHHKLGWDVTVEENQERDEFDELNPYYLISLDNHSKANGCWRLLPTTGRYMIQDTFPTLLRGDDPPQAKNIWELSRFAVSATSNEQSGQIALNRITFQMMSELITFADQRNIKAYVTAMSVAVERLMKKAGIPMQRFGDRKSSRVGHTLSVASWIPITNELRTVVAQANSQAPGHIQYQKTPQLDPVETQYPASA